MEYYPVIKKKEITFCNNMDLESIMLIEMSQSGEDKYHMISIICEI